jgi:hypothetical protein
LASRDAGTLSMADEIIWLLDGGRSDAFAGFVRRRLGRGHVCVGRPWGDDWAETMLSRFGLGG